jgi:hypothetical protein
MEGMEPMNQILEWLSSGDLRSDGMANEVVEIVLKNPHLFEELYEGLSEADDVIRGHAADALEKVARTRADLLLTHVSELVRIAEEDPLPMVKMHVAMILGHLAVYEKTIDESISALLFLLDDDSVFVVSWTIVSLCIIARKYPGERDQIVDQIATLRNDRSIAIRTKVRKAMNVLTNEESPFPKGWIKSEHLKGIGG